MGLNSPPSRMGSRACVSEAPDQPRFIDRGVVNIPEKPSEKEGVGGC